VAYSPDGKHIVSASRELTVKIWNAATGKEASACFDMLLSFAAV